MLSDGQLLFKSSPSGTVIDPVCLMVLDSDNRHFSSEFEGKKYYFCMGRCKDEFDLNPEHYILGIDANQPIKQHN